MLRFKDPSSETVILPEGFRGFPQYLQASVSIVPQACLLKPSFHKFPLPLPTVLTFQGKVFRLPLCNTTDVNAICCYMLLPLNMALMSWFYCICIL
jgi:hypothetical protein